MRQLTRSIILSFGLSICALAGATQEAETPREGGLTGTGIVGLVSYSKTIDINGVSIALPNALIVDSAFGPITADALYPGAMVALHLEGTFQDLTFLDARQVLQLIGPVLAQNNKTLVVMGTVVQRAETSLDVNDGDWVSVSGYWREDGIVATRIDAVPHQEFVQIQGTYQPVTTGVGKIGDTYFRGEIPDTAKPGDVVRLRGRVSGGEIIVETLELNQFKSSVRTVLAQGYLSLPDAQGRYTVLGTGITSVTDQPEMINPQELMTVCGVDGNLLVDDFEIEEQDILFSAATLGCL